MYKGNAASRNQLAHAYTNHSADTCKNLSSQWAQAQLLSAFAGNHKLAATPPANVVITTPKLAVVETWYPPKSASIFAPIKPKTRATALSKYLSSLMIVFTKPYKALRLRIANMLEEYTMKGSCVMPNTCTNQKQ